MSNWRYTGKETEPDERHRVTLGAAIKTPPGVRYRVMQNSLGQILLDPVKTVPAYEAWIHEKPGLVEAFQASVLQAEAGQVVSIDLSAYEDEDE